jgi:hypothetical protein
MAVAFHAKYAPCKEQKIGWFGLNLKRLVGSGWHGSNDRLLPLTSTSHDISTNVMIAVKVVKWLFISFTQMTLTDTYRRIRLEQVGLIFIPSGNQQWHTKWTHTARILNQAFVKQIAVEKEPRVCLSKVFYSRLMNSTISVSLNY